MHCGGLDSLVAKFEVNMTPGKLYDYLLKQTYSTFSGIVCEVIGLIIIVQFFNTHNWGFLVFGILIVVYLPLLQYLRARTQCAKNPAFKTPLRYTVSDGGIRVMSGGSEQALEWSSVTKVVSTTGSVILYTADADAIIFPKRDMGDAKDTAIQLISTHVDPKHVNIR